MYNLKPCPLCGTVPTSDIEDVGDIEDVVYPVARSKHTYQCVCTNPECGVAVIGWNIRGAMEAWNNQSNDEGIEKINVTDNIIFELRHELKDAYKHITLLSSQLLNKYT